jgi:uncharacterized protein (DUF983 family)
MIVTHDYRIKKVEDAEEAADGFVAREKQIIELGKKWGPCPKCGGNRLESESWEKNRVRCLKCGHNFDRQNAGASHEILSPIARHSLNLL